MPSVQVRDNEPFEIALRRFKRGCEKAGILTETRRREFMRSQQLCEKEKSQLQLKDVKEKLVWILSEKNLRTKNSNF